MKIILVLFFVFFSLVGKAQLDATNDNDAIIHEYVYFSNGKIKSDFMYAKDTLLIETYYWKNESVQFSVGYDYQGKNTIVSTKQYTKEGVLLSEETTFDGLKDGYNNVYYKSGEIRVEATDKSGVRLHETLYRKDGSVKQKCVCDSQTRKCNLEKYGKNGEMKKSFETNFNGYGILIYK